MAKKPNPWGVESLEEGHRCNCCGKTKFKVVSRPFPKDNGLRIRICNDCLGDISRAIKEAQDE